MFNTYEHCNFHWKWRNLSQTDNGGYEPPNGGDDSNDSDNDRVSKIGDGCISGKVKTVYTNWGEMVTDPGTQMNDGNCSPIIAEQIRSVGFAETPTDNPLTIQSSTLSISSGTTTVSTTVTELFKGEAFNMQNIQPL